MEYGEALNSKDELKGRDGVDLLARMIYAEAGGESSEGKCGLHLLPKTGRIMQRKQQNSVEPHGRVPFKVKPVCNGGDCGLKT